MKTIVDIVLKFSEYFSENIAIIQGNRSIDYFTLYEQSKKLAQYLHQFLKQASPIAICLPKCIEIYSSLYGILLSGNYYIPIDYRNPPERISYILDDSRAVVLITTIAKLKFLFSEISDHFSYNDVVIVELIEKNLKITLLSDIHQRMVRNDLPKVSSDNIAYILYSSGSTGLPKGIVHTHQSACAFITWACHYLNLSFEDRVAQFSDISFDLSIFDIFSTALCGSALVVVPEFFGDVAKISRFINQTQITVWYSVPSVFLRKETSEAWQFLKNSRLRHLIFAGEKIPLNLFLIFNSYLPETTSCHNWYGPTETNVCTYYQIDRNHLSRYSEIPIGQACPFVEVKVLSDFGEGELLVSGGSVMLGYWVNGVIDRSSLREWNGGFYYATGDLIKISDLNQMIYLGRNDNLIKINGYRIYTDEIEKHLIKNNMVLEAVVVCLTHLESYKIAAVISTHSNQLSALDLQRHCKQFLPIYMLPEVILIKDSIPRTDRGKIDYHTIVSLLSESECQSYDC